MKRLWKVVKAIEKTSKIRKITGKMLKIGKNHWKKRRISAKTIEKMSKINKNHCKNIENRQKVTEKTSKINTNHWNSTKIIENEYLDTLENFYNPAAVKQISNPYGFTYVWKLQKPSCITEDISRNISNFQSVAEILKFEITYSSFNEHGIWPTIHLVTCIYMY